MYPAIVDMNENESSKYLRMLELDAYSNVVAALRAQGPPTTDKLKILKDVGAALRIPHERCKAEIRKVILDERLNTIAYFSCGQVETADDWIKEGRRLISLMPRVTPQTIYSAIADEVSDTASTSNEQLPLAAHTERKRPTPTSQVLSSNIIESLKPQPFRINELHKNEEIKKRKLSLGIENSTLAQHLIGPSKVSSVQQLYRQRAKAKTKEHLQPRQKEQDQEFKHLAPHPRILQQFQQKIQKVPLPVQSLPTPSPSPRINILQNITIQPVVKDEESIEEIKNEINSFIVPKSVEPNCSSPQPGCSNENQAPKLQPKQTLVNIKPNHTITYKHVASPGPSSDLQKSLKVCSARKTVTKTVPGQKLIIVSNAQSIATTSILQRTLSIPFVKNLSVKNFDKYKIVSTSSNNEKLHITSLANTTTPTTNLAKHKVVTVRTNPTTKKVIPLAHLHALTSKGSIKVLPVGGKLLTKTPTISSSSPVYIMHNTSGVHHALTKSISSTSLVMTSRPQQDVNNVEKKENSETNVKDALIEIDKNSVVDISLKEKSTDSKEIVKNSIIEDNLRSSDHFLFDNEHSEDIESKISQLTAIPQSCIVTNLNTEMGGCQKFATVDMLEQDDCQEEPENFNNDKDQETEQLLKDLEGDNSSDVVFENLDSSEGNYCETSESQDNVETNENTFMVEVQNAIMTDINAVN